jgi:hypothetical protein
MNLSQIKKVSFNFINKPESKIIKYFVLLLGSFILLSFLILAFFSDQIINSYIKKNLEKALKGTYTSSTIYLGKLHFNIWNARLSCDSIKLKANDSTITLSMMSFSIEGVSPIQVLLHKDFTTDIFSESIIDIKNVVINYPQSHIQLSLGQIHISVPDSEIITDSIQYYSLMDDEQFFAKDKFRQTRTRLNISKAQITGLDFPALISGNIYKAKTIKIFSPNTDILVNMDKPYDKNSSPPQMPNEFLSSMKQMVKIDNLKIINGQLEYKERYILHGKPGIISLKKVYISVKNIYNHLETRDTSVVNGEAIFMNAGTMKLSMVIPLSSKEFSLRYSGSLSAMNIKPINEFIEPGEHRRIETGDLHSASFNINVKSGNANGTIRADYKDLTIAVLNNTTGSGNGLVAKLSSIIGKIFITRGNNMPDGNGSIKIGNIHYNRNHDDYFLQFVWFALRSGIGDLVGF